MNRNYICMISAGIWLSGCGTKDVEIVYVIDEKFEGIACLDDCLACKTDDDFYEVKIDHLGKGSVPKTVVGRWHQVTVVDEDNTPIPFVDESTRASHSRAFAYCSVSIPGKVKVYVGPTPIPNGLKENKCN